MAQIGRYELGKELDRGGFATIYKAQDTKLNRPVVLKVLDSYWLDDVHFVERFQDEMETAKTLRHPNILSVYEAGNFDKHLCVVMAYVNGRNLSRYLKEKKRLSISQALRLLEQIAAALDYAHNAEAIHTDLKPNNILIRESGRDIQIYLLDFGIHKAMQNSRVLTSLDTLSGSPEYMSPEQANPARINTIGPATDGYALGILAYKMLTGRVPFPGNTPGTLYSHEHEPVPPPRTIDPNFPQPVASVLLKQLGKRPTSRFETASAFVQALQAGFETQQAQLAQEEVRANLYAQLQTAVDEEAWAIAMEVGQQLLAHSPNYRDTIDLVEQAQAELDRPTLLKALGGLFGRGKKSS